MTSEQARTLCEAYLADIITESATTKKVLAAVPADKSSYAPSEKCMSALKLCNHIATSEIGFLTAVAEGAFTQQTFTDLKEATPAAAIMWYEQRLPGAIERVKALSGEALAKDVDFFGIMKMPAVAVLGLNVKHGVHHRGQLSSYLRPMGAKVPSIYGPSGDSQ
jgi:uncharacterized damage-inducible protein DinB